MDELFLVLSLILLACPRLGADVVVGVHAQSTCIANQQNLTTSDPVVLSDKMCGQWGGHTFKYLVEGKTGLFWSARPWESGDPLKKVVIGQYPKPGSRLKAKVTTISFTDDPTTLYCPQPLLVRTPDGYIHIFIGRATKSTNPNLKPGRFHYYRSSKPEDITTLIDRTEMIPKIPFSQFHLRANVGISSDGRRMALVALAISEDGSVAFNTPVIFYGDRKGLDFVFSNPVQYSEPMSLFYPQVAITDQGVIVVGQVYDKYPPTVFTRLLHLDWHGKVLHRQDIILPDQSYICYDVRPARFDDWSKLHLYISRVPADKTATCSHEFWVYDAVARKLRRLRTLDVAANFSNPGSWLPLASGTSVFINNPSSSQLHIWEGDILGSGRVTHTPLPKTDPTQLGYLSSSYVVVPSLLNGSVPYENVIYIGVDYLHKDKLPDQFGPVSYFLWRVDCGSNLFEMPMGS